MSENQSQIPLAHRGKRPRFFEASGTDELMSMVLELTAEMWVIKKRLYLLERVAGQAGVSLTPQIEAYELSDAEVAELDSLRRGMIATILRSLETDMAERSRIKAEAAAIGSADTAAVTRAA